MENKKMLLSIGEVANAVGVTRRMILNYEERGLVKPDVKEGINGNRYYTADTLTRIRTIRSLQDMGLALDEIRGYYEDSIDFKLLLARLETLRDELNLNIEKLSVRAGIGSDEVEFTTIPWQTVYRVTRRVRTIAEKTEQLREAAFAAMRSYGSDTSRRMYFIEFPLDDPELVSCCVAVPAGSVGENIERLPSVQALCVYHRGGYEELPAARERLFVWAAEKQFELLGVCRHIYLEGPPQHRDKARFITQVVLPVADRRRGL